MNTNDFTERYLDADEVADVLPDFCRTNDIPPSFFTSAPLLNTFYNNNRLTLGIISYQNEDFLFFTKRFRKEWRFLFKEPNSSLIGAIHEKYGLNYIASAFITERDFHAGESDTICDEEQVVLDFKTILSEHDTLYKDYAKSISRETNLVIERYEYNTHVAGLLKFLTAWRHVRSDRQNKHANIFNDINFLAHFGFDERITGIVIKDAGNIVAYNLNLPNDLDAIECISAFSKVLRGHENLGIILKIENAKAMLANGFERVNIGHINNDFKKRLARHGSTIKLYSRQLYKDEKLELKMPENEWLSYTDL